MGADLEIVIKGKDAGASKALSNVGDEMDGLQKRSSNLFSRGLSPLKDIMMGGLKVAAAGAATGLGALAAGIGVSVKAAMDMEQQLADISASMGTTSAETADLKKLITNLGLDPKLKVSASEAADAIGTLGTAGVSVTDILNGAARSTVLLANATGADFGSAAAIASDAMALWKVEAKDLNTVVNGVTATTVASKFGIEDYRLALAAAGGVAATVGVEFDDFNAVIATISPSFSSGSDAGTSFKTFLQRLVPQSNEAAGAMRGLGLFTGLTHSEFEKAEAKIFKYQGQLAALDPTSKNYEERATKLQEKIKILQSSLVEGSNAFFDANGNMKSMAEISGILNTALGGLSEEQKNEALSTIFGTDAMRAAAAMADTGKVKFESLKATMAKTDAEQQAATRMNTLKGAIEILSGVFETLKIQIGEKFLPVFTSLASKFGEFLTKHADQIVNWAGIFADNLEALANWVLAVAEDGDVMNDWLTHMHPSLQATVLGVASFVGWVKDTVIPMGQFIANTIGLKGILVILVSLFAASFIPTIVSVVGSIVSVVGWIASFVGGLGGIGAAIGPVLVAMGPIILIIAAIGAALALLYLAWSKNWFGIRDITSSVGKTILDWFAGLPESIKGFGTDVYNGAVALIGKIKEGFSSSIESVKQAASSILTAVVGALSGGAQMLSEIFQKGKDIVGKIIEGIGSMITDAKNKVGEVMSGLVEGFNSKVESIKTHFWTVAKDIVSSITNGMNEVKGSVSDAIGGVLGGAVNTFNTTKDSIKNGFLAEAKNIVWSLRDGFNAVKNDPVGSINTVLTNIGTALDTQAQQGGLKGKMAEMGKNAVWALRDGINNFADDPVGAMESAFGKITTAVNTVTNVGGGLYNHFKTKAGELIGAMWSGLGGSGEDGARAIAGAWGAVVDWVNRNFDANGSIFNHVYTKAKETGVNMVNGMISGLQDTFGRVQDAISWLTDYLPQWVKDALGIHSPSTVFAAIGQNIMAGLAQGIEQMTATPQLAMAGATSGLVGAAGATINNSRTTTTTNTFNVSGGNAVQDPFEATRVLNALYGS